MKPTDWLINQPPQQHDQTNIEPLTLQSTPQIKHKVKTLVRNQQSGAIPECRNKSMFR